MNKFSLPLFIMLGLSVCHANAASVDLSQTVTLTNVNDKIGGYMLAANKCYIDAPDANSSKITSCLNSLNKQVITDNVVALKLVPAEQKKSWFKDGYASYVSMADCSKLYPSAVSQLFEAEIASCNLTRSVNLLQMLSTAFQ